MFIEILTSIEILSKLQLQQRLSLKLQLRQDRLSKFFLKHKIGRHSLIQIIYYDLLSHVAE